MLANTADLALVQFLGVFRVVPSTAGRFPEPSTSQTSTHRPLSFWVQSHVENLGQGASESPGRHFSERRSFWAVGRCGTNDVSALVSLGMTGLARKPTGWSAVQT